MALSNNLYCRGDMVKTAQAAVEFLTTYGWAFLIILITIGALAYFGVLNPSNYLPNRCIFSPEVECMETSIASASDVLSIRFRNNVGTTADFSMNATYIGSSNPTVVCETNPGGAVIVDDLGTGRIQRMDCDFGSVVDFPQGEKVKIDISILYTKSGGVFQVPVKGEVYVGVI